MTIIDKIKDLLRMLAENIHKRRRVVLALSCVVVFVTTYMLILPAFTLEKTKAAEQGGIDVPGVTTTAEDVSEEDADANDGQADAEDAQAETGKTEDGKAEDSGSKSKDSGETKADSAQTADPLTFEDEHYTIAVDDKNSVLPENTEIKVEEIDKDKDAKKYEKHFDDALAAIQEEKDGENVSDLEFARFYDISLVSDGKEVTLGNGDKVSVNIEYDKELRKALGVENKDNIRIIHFAENKDTGKVEAEVLDNKEAKVEVNTDKKDQLKEASFEAESFSVYAVVYTVDFEYEDEATHEVYKYSMESGSSITLKKLAVILGITTKDKADEFIENVEDVKFSDEKLVKVEKTDNGWTLKSLKAFDTTEALTITMKDGSVYEVKVTDDQDLTPAIATRITASLTANTDVSYVAGEDAYQANFTMNFTVPKEQILQDTTLVYKLGDNVRIPDNALNITHTAIDHGVASESFDYMFVKGDDGRYYIKITFRDDYLNKVEDVGKNKISFNALFWSTSEEEKDNITVHFSDDIDIDVPVKDVELPENQDAKNDIFADKSYKGTGTTSDGKTYVEYTTRVSTNKGTRDTIKVSDTLKNLSYTINGTNQDLSVSDLQVTITDKNGNPVTATISKTDDNTSFETTLSKLNAGEYYDITYRYVFDKKLQEEGTDGGSFKMQASGSNTVSAESKGQKTSDGDGFSIERSNNPVTIDKKGSLTSDGKIEWRIDLVLKSGNHFLVDEAFSTAQDLVITPDTGVSRDGNKLTFANAGTYSITYKTDADPDVYKNKNVKNKAIVDNNPEWGKEIGVNVPATGKDSVQKSLVDKEIIEKEGTNETYKLTWNVIFDIPEGGFKAGTELKDSLFFNKHAAGQKYDIHEFTAEQQAELVGQLEELFGRNNLEVTLNKGSYNYDLIIKFKNDWTNPENIKTANLTYSSTAYVDMNTINMGLSTQTGKDSFNNRFSVDDISAEAKFTFSREVNKIDDSSRDGKPVTEHTVTRDKKDVKWDIVIDLRDNYQTLNVTDMLPAGLTIKDIYIGGEYNSEKWGPSGSDPTVFEFKGGNQYMNNTVQSMTAVPQADGTTKIDINIAVTNEETRPQYLKNAEKLWIFVTAEVNESEFAPVEPVTKSYVNNVTVKGDGEPLGDADQTQKTTLDQSAIAKNYSDSRWENFHEVIYTVDLNSDGHALMVTEDGTPIEGATYTAEDVLQFKKQTPDGNDINVMLIPGSVVLKTKDSSGNWVTVPNTVDWAYQYVESKDGDMRYKTITLSGLPDQMPLRLEYAYRFDLADTVPNKQYNLGDVKNYATVHGATDYTISNEFKKNWSQFDTTATSESTNSLTLSKVDLDNYNKLLPGAKFILEKWNGNSWVAVNAISQEQQFLTSDSPAAGVNTVYTTSENTADGRKYGSLKIYQPYSENYTGEKFEYNVCYRVREYSAPAGGYILSNNPEMQPAGYFWFSYEGSTRDDVQWPNDRIKNLSDDLTTESDTFYVTNAKVPSIKITKKFLGDAEIDENTKKSMTFTVKNEAGEVIATLTYADILTNNNVITEGIVNGGKYSVTETAVDVTGTIRTTTYSVNGGDEPDPSTDNLTANDVEVVNGIGTVAFTNIYETEKTSIKVTKDWLDYKDDKSQNPSKKTIKFQVYQVKDGETEGTPFIAAGESKPATYEVKFNETTKTWEEKEVNNLPLYDKDGNKYKYYVVETDPTETVTTTYKLSELGKETSASKTAVSNDRYTIYIVNRDLPPKGKINVKKVWDGADDSDMTPINVELWAKEDSSSGGGSGTSEMVPVYFVGGYEGPWAYQRVDPIEYEMGSQLKLQNRTANDFAYTIYADNPNGKTLDTGIIPGNGEVITPTIKEKAIVYVASQALTFNEAIQVDKYVEAVPTESAYRTATLDSDNNWKTTFDNLPYGYNYYIKETNALSGFETTYEYTDGEGNTTTGTISDVENMAMDSGRVVVTNKKVETPKGSVKVTKAFSGIGAEKIPDAFQILASWTENGEEKSAVLKISGELPENVTREGSGLSYSWTIDNLPVGTNVTFVESGYDVAGYDVTVTGSATADDKTTASAVAAIDPDIARFVNTYTESKGMLKITKRVTINGEMAPMGSPTPVDGTYTFVIKKDGKPINYGVLDGSEEAIVDGKVQIRINNGVPVYQVIKDLPVGEYTIEEETPTNNTILASATGGVSVSEDKVVSVEVKTTPVDASDDGRATFVNDYSTTSATVKKVWDDNESSDRPTSLTVELLADGESMSPARTVTLNASDDWEATIDELPKYNNGVEIDYSWLETVPEGYYLTNVEKEGRVTTLTNKPTKYDLKTSYVGTKFWDDTGATDRPSELAVTLYADGQPLTNIPQWNKDDANNQWVYTFSDLPVFDSNGQIIHYTAEETAPEGYAKADQQRTVTSGTFGTIEYENGTDRVTPDNTVNWTLGSLIDLSFVAIKPTANGDVTVWTHRTPLPSEVTAITNAIKGGALPGCANRNIVFYSGTGAMHTPHGDVTVLQDGLNVTLDFGATSVWSQFIVGQFNKNNSSKYEPGTTSFTNTKLKDFEFTKVWENGEGQSAEWPEGKSITVTFNASTTDSEKALTDQTLTFSPTSVPEGWTVTADSTNKKYTFKTTGLAAKKDGKELTYYVVESKVDGYKDPAYADGNGNVQTNVNKATNGQQVINKPEDAVELPMTGGIGTTIFYILGSILVIGGGIYFISRRRAMK